MKDNLNKFGLESGECAFAPWARQVARKESQCVLEDWSEDEQEQVAHGVLNYLVARQNSAKACLLPILYVQHARRQQGCTPGRKRELCKKIRMHMMAAAAVERRRGSSEQRRWRRRIAKDERLGGCSTCTHTFLMGYSAQLCLGSAHLSVQAS